MAMNEVKQPNIWLADCNKLRSADSRSNEVDVRVVLLIDFDAERQARLEAERQVADLIEARDNRVAKRVAAIDELTDRAEKAERQVGELREQLARAIYRSWYAAPGYVPWVERGNSTMQNKARAEANAQINTTSTEGKDHE